MINFVFRKVITNQFERFKRSEHGAVTVDFVVLTATAVLIGAAATNALKTEMTTATDNIVIVE